MLTPLHFILIALAALAAGAVNALAGGRTLITFPMLTFLGVPPVAANVTNTVALCPGYFGGTLAQWGDLKTLVSQPVRVPAWHDQVWLPAGGDGSFSGRFRNPVTAAVRNSSNGAACV
jgi:hypothetical protein